MKENNCKADLHILQPGTAIFLNVCVGVFWWVWVGGGRSKAAITQTHLEVVTAPVMPSYCSRSRTQLAVFKVDLMKALIQRGSLLRLVDAPLSEMTHDVSQNLEVYFHFFLLEQLSRNSGEYFREEDKKKRTPTTSDLSFWWN